VGVFFDSSSFNEITELYARILLKTVLDLKKLALKPESFINDRINQYYIRHKSPDRWLDQIASEIEEDAVSIIDFTENYFFEMMCKIFGIRIAIKAQNRVLKYLEQAKENLPSLKKMAREKVEIKRKLLQNKYEEVGRCRR